MSPSFVHHSPPTQSLSPGEELQIAIVNMDPTVQFMHSVEASTWEADVAHAQELADEAKEEADYQAALVASLSHSPPSNNTRLSPTDFASTSCVTSLHIASSSHVAVSHVAPSLHVAFLHSGPLSLVHFTPSPPASPPNTSTKILKHTSHLHSEWMWGYKDKTSQSLRKQGQAQGDMALLHKFFIMFWQQVSSHKSHVCHLHPY